MRSHGEGRDGARPPSDRLPTAPARPAPVPGGPDVLGAESLLDLQRAAGNAAVAGMMEDSPVHEVLASGGGTALDAPVRADMESRFGADFSDVRVHTDDRAHRSAVAVNAQAYTVGSDVVFRRGGYDPSSHAGRHVLAHELTHVVQQRQGPVDGTDAGGGVKVSDPGDRFEREASATADRVLAEPVPTPEVQRVEIPGEPTHLQRLEESDDEEEVDEGEEPRYPPDWQHGAPTRPTEDDPNVAPLHPPVPDQGPYRSPSPRSDDSDAGRELSEREKIARGLQKAGVPAWAVAGLVVLIVAALLDPEPFSKVVLLIGAAAAVLFFVAIGRGGDVPPGA